MRYGYEEKYQKQYTTTEREQLLAIVETLQEFRNIVLGQRIQIHTDHHNLTYKTKCVLQWCLIKEEKNVVSNHFQKAAQSAILYIFPNYVAWRGGLRQFPVWQVE